MITPDGGSDTFYAFLSFGDHFFFRGNRPGSIYVVSMNIFLDRPAELTLRHNQTVGSKPYISPFTYSSIVEINLEDVRLGELKSPAIRMQELSLVWSHRT